MFLCIAILAFIFMMYIKYTNRRDKLNDESFLERESAANSTRRQSLDNLDYITIPIDKLPFFENASKEITAFQSRITELSKKTIVNLSGITNTDLKLQYGAANLPLLSEYDNNFTILADTLAKWGAQLLEEGFEDEAVTVLEYGIQCNTDISGNYITLAKCYARRGETDKIRVLRSRAEKLNTMMKDSILNKLDALVSSPLSQ